MPRDIVWMAEAFTKKLTLGIQLMQCRKIFSRGIVPLKVLSYTKLPYDMKLYFLYMALVTLSCRMIYTPKTGNSTNKLF